MSEKKRSSVQIIVDEDGISRVRLVGQTWTDQETANKVYQRIAHLIDQIDRTVKSPQPILTQ